VSKFRHPLLTRGVVHTSAGAFAVCRGIIEAPDAIGHECGWLPIDDAQPADNGVADGAEYLQKPRLRIAGRHQ
jgi:hypothetical protein